MSETNESKLYQYSNLKEFAEIYSEVTGDKLTRNKLVKYQIENGGYGILELLGIESKGKVSENRIKTLYRSINWSLFI